MSEISQHAIVESGARLAGDVRVGPFSYVGSEVEIGPECVIASNVSIVGRTVLGARTRVFPMAVIGVPDPRTGQAGPCILGEANTIREHVTLHAGSDERPTRIGNDNLIMIASQVGSGAIVGDHGIFDNCSRIGAGAVVGDYVRMSGYAAIGDGAKLGAYSFVAGYAEVARDAPPYAMLQGFPVRVRSVNWRNLKACGFGEEDIRALKNAFRELFNGSAEGVNDKALRRMQRARSLSPHVRVLIDAVQQSLDSPRETADE